MVAWKNGCLALARVENDGYCIKFETIKELSGTLVSKRRSRQFVEVFSKRQDCAAKKLGGVYQKLYKD